MIGLVFKDMLILRKAIKTYAIFLAFYLVMTLLDIFSLTFTTTMLQIIVMMLPMSAFSYDEAAKWDRYTMTFPLGRRAIVAGRYLFALTMALCAGLFGLISCVLTSIFESQNLVFENLLSVILCLGLGLFYCDILLPLCYKLGPERARPYLYIVIFAPLVLFFGSYQVGLWEYLDFSNLEQLSSGQILGLSSLLLLIPALGMLLSFRISCKIIEKKEF